MSAVLKTRTSEAWTAYRSASSDLDSFYAAYQENYSQYAAASVATYALWGTGAGAFAASLFLPTRIPLALSLPGKLSFSAGVLAAVAGNFMQTMAGSYAVSSRHLWEEYKNATDDLDTLYADYEDAFVKYKSTALLSYVLWGAGSLAVPVSFFLPGPRYAIGPVLPAKIIMASGMALIAGGNYAYSMALADRERASEAWTAYATGTEELETLYDAYAALATRYKIKCALSFGLWGTGAALMIADLFIPWQRVFSPRENSSVSVGLSPEPAGVSLYVEKRL